jgi:hypothetical protein
MKSMEKKITLSIPERTLDNIVTISHFYGQNTNQTIIDMLNTIANSSSSVIAIGKERKRSTDFEKNLYDLLQAGFLTASFFQQILKKLNAEDLFFLQDLDYDLDEGRLWIHYAATPKSTLPIISFALEITHENYTLQCDSHIDLEKIDPEVLDTLEDRAASFFEELGCNYEVTEDGLMVQYSAACLEDLPSLKKISKIIKEFFEESGIKY